MRPHTIANYHIVLNIYLQNAKEQQGDRGYRVPSVRYHRTQQRYVTHWRPPLGTVRPNVSLSTPETTDHRYGNVSKTILCTFEVEMQLTTLYCRYTTLLSK